MNGLLPVCTLVSLFSLPHTTFLQFLSTVNYAALNRGDLVNCSGFPLLLKKIPGLFQDPHNIFLGLFHSQAMFKYTDKEQLITLYIQCNSNIQCKTFIKEKVQLIMKQEYFTHLFTDGVLYRKQFFSSSS